MKALRQEFADTMLKVGMEDSQLVVMVGDISHGILQPFAKKFPQRYFNVGICEPTIVNMAAGVAKTGLIPVVHTIAPFIIERAYEQIKLDFGYQNLSGNLISVGSAFDYSQLGCSHHCYSDIALMSQFARAQIFIPGSALEFSELFQQAYAKDAINYFRLTEYPHGVDFSPNQIILGKGVKVKEGRDVTLACIGAQLKNVKEAASILATQDVEAEILYFPTFKPFDKELLAQSLKKTKKVVTVEEASPVGGLYHQVLEVASELENVKLKSLAIRDFQHGYGSYKDLCEGAGLSTEQVITKAKALYNLQETAQV